MVYGLRLRREIIADRQCEQLDVKDIDRRNVSCISFLFFVCMCAVNVHYVTSLINMFK